MWSDGHAGQVEIKTLTSKNFNCSSSFQQVMLAQENCCSGESGRTLGLSWSPNTQILEETQIVARGDHLRGQWMIPSKKTYGLKDIAAKYTKD